METITEDPDPDVGRSSHDEAAAADTGCEVFRPPNDHIDTFVFHMLELDESHTPLYPENGKADGILLYLERSEKLTEDLWFLSV